MPNNVFDVLYLNLYGYLHYSYFPGLGTNPIDMEMGCSVSWQSWGERQRENSQVCSYSKCAENRFSESFGFMGLVIGDYTKHLKPDNELLFSINKKVLHAGHILHTQEVNQEQIKSILWLCRAPSTHRRFNIATLKFLCFNFLYLCGDRNFYIIIY